ncbi:biotin--[acetyl-CoA-carboxylase] ligase [Spiractinospora alimapuensis]|uniref:biotin--[acetyl-CoA-carboxylase] ligase n=1 Tax=Spiractinospora alimapuensis TaxID=2820884 RepID=UPI001F418A2E|nr:biotin--[acetyl-CoA-carboxylase] ligase [Spiractinospora alimapuensis]QVQ51146.1 biotin--[acetyl-CoA-carboxylase] ligase [Spiractinospora alimapuensis]
MTGLTPLDGEALRSATVYPGGLWRDLTVVDATGSTNTDLVERAREGAPEGTVLVTEHQQAGRGRLDRTFVTPPRVALTFSVLLRPEVPPTRLGWLPLLMGLAVVRGIAEVSGLPTWSQRGKGGTGHGAALGLKWPNDVLAGPPDDERKLVGILAETATVGDTPPAIVVGAGTNVHQSAEELPTPRATSLWEQTGEHVDRGRLLRAILAALAEEYTAWVDAAGDPERSGLGDRYRAECSTLGRPVRIHLPAGGNVEATARDVDAGGRLVVSRDDGGSETFSAGDIVHLR